LLFLFFGLSQEPDVIGTPGSLAVCADGLLALEVVLALDAVIDPFLARRKIRPFGIETAFR
jgi:hypothetical protein